MSSAFWGFVGLSASCYLAMLSVSDTDLQRRLFVAAVILGLCSLITLFYASAAAIGRYRRRGRGIEVRFGATAPYQLSLSNIKRYRVGLYNGGEAPAEGAILRLVDIRPRPRELFRGDFPYAVRDDDGKPEVGEGRRINSKQEQYFTIAETWVSSEGKHVIHGLDTKVNGEHYPAHINRDEEWTLSYQATFGNRDPIAFSMAASVEGEWVILRKADGH